MRAVLAVAVFLLPLVAKAAGVTGEQLWTNCKLDGLKEISCQAYLLGAIEMASTVNAALEPFKLKACVPATVTTGQIADVVIGRLRDRPSDRTLPAAQAVLLSVVAAWPCRH